MNKGGQSRAHILDNFAFISLDTPTHLDLDLVAIHDNDEVDPA